MYDRDRHFDRWQFDGRSARPVNATNGISWNDYSRMHMNTYVQVQERRLRTPDWALDDSKLRALLVMFIENRVQIHNPDYSLPERRDAAEQIVLTKVPGWNATIDRLQLEYVAAQHDGTLKERLDELEVQIENLDTLIRMSRKGTTAVVAAVVVLYHRMGKNSVEVGEELGIKPPHVRQILYRLNQVWNEYLEEDFMVETESAAVPSCRSYTREEIDEKLASGEIVIPKTPELKDAPIEYIKPQRPPVSAKSLPGETRTERRARLRAAGLCGDCGMREPGAFAACEQCRAYYTVLARNKKAKAAGVPVPPAPLIIDVQRAVELRNSGLTWKQVAQQLGVRSAGAVLSKVRKAGLWVPGKYHRKPGKGNRNPAKAAELRAAGKTWKEIASELGFYGSSSAITSVRNAGLLVTRKRKTTIDIRWAAELRATGLPWKQVAQQLGETSGDTVLAAVKRAGLWVPEYKKRNLAAPVESAPDQSSVQVQRVPKKKRQRKVPEHNEPTARPIPARTVFQKYFGWMKWGR